MLELNEKITQKEICQKIDVGRTTVNKYLKQLKENGKIERVGKTKGGYWKIIKK